MKSKFSIILFILGVLVLSSNCKSDGAKNNRIDSLELDIVDTTIIIKEEIKEELIITDTQVLFFMPSVEEKQEIMKFYGSYNQYIFKVIYNNFSILYGNVKRALSSHGIEVELTNSEKFTFITENDTIIYDLKIEGQYIGYILADGVNAPLIRNGVQRKKTVSNDIRNYFNIANFNIYN